MALDLPALVRAASGAFFLTVGAIALVLGRRATADKRLARALAAFGAAFGTIYVINNLDVQDEPRFALLAVGAGVLCWVATIVALALIVRRFARSRNDVLLAAGIGLLYFAAATPNLLRDTEGAIAAFRVHESAGPVYIVSQVLQRAHAGLSLGIAALLSRRVADERERAAPLALLAMGVALFWAFAQGLAPDEPAHAFVWLARIVTPMLLWSVAILWLIAAERGRSRWAVLVAVALPAMMFASMIEQRLIDDALARFGNGVARTLAAAALAIAILRYDLLNAGLRARTADRAGGAAVGIASLFIVAQVAIPFVSGPVGLLLGGVVAAGLTLAGPSFQRMAERRAAPEKETSFRAAVRMALKDGHITREEERHLVVLADHLGIRPARAYELRDEEERARGAR